MCVLEALYAFVIFLRSFCLFHQHICSLHYSYLFLVPIVIILHIIPFHFAFVPIHAVLLIAAWPNDSLMLIIDSLYYVKSNGSRG